MSGQQCGAPDCEGCMDSIESLTLDANGTGRVSVVGGDTVTFNWKAQSSGRSFKGTEPPEFTLTDAEGIELELWPVDEDELQERLQDAWYGIPAHIRNGRGAP